MICSGQIWSDISHSLDRLNSAFANSLKLFGRDQKRVFQAETATSVVAGPGDRGVAANLEPSCAGAVQLCGQSDGHPTREAEMSLD